MSDFSERPLIAGSITGLRSFGVDGFGRLCGVVHAEVWKPGVNTASCVAFGGGGSWAVGMAGFQAAMTRVHMQMLLGSKAVEQHEVAMKACSCGYYAYFDTDHNPHHAPENVLGLIEGSGRVTVGDRGFRAEKARIVGLIGQPPAPWWRGRTRMFWVTLLVALYSATLMTIYLIEGQPVWLTALMGVLTTANATGAHREFQRRRRSGVIGSIVPDSVRVAYPDVTVYPSLAAALAEHPLLPPERPDPAVDPQFWDRRLV